MNRRSFLALSVALAIVLSLFVFTPAPNVQAAISTVTQSPAANAVPGTGSVTITWTQSQYCTGGEVGYWVNDYTHTLNNLAAASVSGSGPYLWTAIIPQQNPGDVVAYQVHNWGVCTEEFDTNGGRFYGYGQGPSSTTTYHAILLNGDLAEWRANEIIGTSGTTTYYLTWDNANIYVAFSGGFADTDRLNIAIDVDPGTNNVTGSNATDTFAGATFAGYLTPDYVVQSTGTTNLDVYTRSGTNWGTGLSIYSASTLNRLSSIAELRIPRSNVGLSTTSNAFGVYLWLANNSDAMYTAFGTDNPATGGRLRTETGWTSSGSGLTPNVDFKTDYNSSETRTFGIASLRNLYVSNGTGTLANRTTKAANVTVASGATLGANASNRLEVSGNWSNDGTFDPATGLVLFTGTSAQALGSATSSSFYDFNLNDGLLGYWKFDEGSGGVARDSSGYGFDGVLTGGPTYVTTVPSVIAFPDPSAVSLPGAPSWVDLGNRSEFMNLHDFTISQWVLLNNVNADSPNDWATPIGKGTFNGHGWLVLFHLAGAHEINLYLNPDPFVSSNIAATIPAPSGGWVAGQWYHYAFTRSGSTIRGYLNGVEQVVATDSTVPGTNIAHLSMGQTSAGTYYWDGQIDETRIYTRGLAATEIQALASGYHPNSSINTVTLGAPINVSHQLRINSGTLDVSASNYAIALQGDLERNGGVFTPGDNTVTFNGAGMQNLNTDAFTFNNVAVGAGVTLATSADVTVTTGLNNSGVTQETKAVSGTSAIRFGLANITIMPTLQGSLSILQVQRRDQDHPHATGTVGHGVGWGRYWTITPNSGANDTFSATLTLPQNSLTNPRDCKYPASLGGAGWDCDDGTHTTSTATTVTRSGISSFSDWAVGGNVGPTAIALRSISATAQGTSVPIVLIPVALMLVVGVIVWQCKQRLTVRKR